jgi:aminopeptidase-like protein
MRYNFMHKSKDAYGETILQFMDFKGARLVKFRLSEVDQIEDEELKKDVRTQMERIDKAPYYTGQYTKYHKDKSPYSNE